MTTTPNYAQIAAAVYQACNHFDPYLPPLSADLARAWGRLFEKHALNVDDLIAAVDKVYDEHGSGYRPLPKDICDAARTIRAQRTQSETAAERRAREDRQDAALAARSTTALNTYKARPQGEAIRQPAGTNHFHTRLADATKGFGQDIPD